MAFFNKQKAFTIAEVMIVLLILTIIFAACAPFITKRRISANINKNAVWNWASGNYSSGPMNAFYYPGDTQYTGEVFFGLTPKNKSSISTIYSPLAKMIIRSGGVTSNKIVQRQIQFRFGRDNSIDKGDFAGTVLVDSTNMLFGGEYPLKNIKTDDVEMKYNTSFGYNALSSVTSGSFNTAFGAGALNQLSTSDNNTALGYNAGYRIRGAANTLIGYKAGENFEDGDKNTIIGYEAGKSNTLTKARGDSNIFIGAYSGNHAERVNRNVAVGYNALRNLKEGDENVAIGYNALGKLEQGSYNVAIGYNACSNMKNGSYKTCIGANSGPQEGSSGSNYLSTIDGDDKEMRTYIGARPNNTMESMYPFGGDAVLEIHNIKGLRTALNNYPSNNSNATTVINGNLFVRGKTFFTSGDALYNFRTVDPSGSATEHGIGYKPADAHEICATNQRTYYFDSQCPRLTSDRRLKNIGSKNLDGLKAIRQLKVYNYNFINDKNKLPHVGVMAQDLLTIFPNSVFKDDDGYYTIRWDEMFYASINALKELDKKIVALVKRATKVETQITKLEKENLLLKSEVEKLSLRVKNLKKEN